MGKSRERKPLSYDEKKAEFVRFLESRENRIMVLATAYQNRVTARNVLVANRGLDLYFFTWRHSRKCVQIEKNARVALCKDTVQIEGLAEILGGLVDKSTKRYTDIMRDKFPEAVKRWEDRPGMVVVRVKPTFVVIGGSGDENIYLDFLDLENKKAYAERWAYF